MTAAEFLRLVTEVCALALPPTITPDRLRAYAQAESGLNPAAISPPNRNGTRDYGLMQVNSTNLPPGMTLAELMEPCTNLRVGARILAEADRRAACLYNSGKPNCPSRYPARIEAAAARPLGQPARPPQPTPAPAPDPDRWDVWASPAPTLVVELVP